MIPSAKAAVMTPKYRMKVQKDKTKYNKKDKHKGRKNGPSSFHLHYKQNSSIIREKGKQPWQQREKHNLK
jgi:hypothetical protein